MYVFLRRCFQVREDTKLAIIVWIINFSFRKYTYRAVGWDGGSGVVWTPRIASGAIIFRVPTGDAFRLCTGCDSPLAVRFRHTAAYVMALKRSSLKWRTRARWPSPVVVSFARITRNQTKDDISLSSFKIITITGNADLEFSNRVSCRCCTLQLQDGSQFHQWVWPFVSIICIQFAHNY